MELIGAGKMNLLEEYLLKTPEGILDMMRIKGIGPKKIAVIWKELQVESPGELLYACHENRLSLLKGFGKKTQDNVIEAIEFFQKQKGNYLYAQAEALALEIGNMLGSIFPSAQVAVTGSFARQNETVEQLEFVVAIPSPTIAMKIAAFPEFFLLDTTADYVACQYKEGIRVILHSTDDSSAVGKMFRTTNADGFHEAFFEQFPHVVLEAAASEQAIFSQAGMQYVPPALRESGTILDHALHHTIPQLIQPTDIRGIIHCHSNWSDGTNTLEELVAACKENKYEYLVISDHSKAAFYAQGLSQEKIAEQHRLVDALNARHAPFKIFKSIESDILNDGSLDYPDDILASFDLVIASVHSNLKMTEEKAMQRLMKAIENPYTTIMGHLTGRLLLSRKGYPVDHRRIIDACAAHDVVIEINAHPRRLDMSWQWLQYALSKNVLVSIDPDAHCVADFANTRFGVLVAQKGMVTPSNNLSSFPLGDFENFITKKKQKIFRG